MQLLKHTGGVRCEDRPVQVLQQVRLWSIGQTEDVAQQGQQMDPLKPDVTVSRLQANKGAFQSEDDAAENEKERGLTCRAMWI